MKRREILEVIIGILLLYALATLLSLGGQGM